MHTRHSVSWGIQMLKIFPSLLIVSSIFAAAPALAQEKTVEQPKELNWGQGFLAHPTASIGVIPPCCTSDAVQINRTLHQQRDNPQLARVTCARYFGEAPRMRFDRSQQVLRAGSVRRVTKLAASAVAMMSGAPLAGLVGFAQDLGPSATENEALASKRCYRLLDSDVTIK